MQVRNNLIIFSTIIFLIFSFCSPSKAQTLTGNLNVAVQNVDASFTSGTPVFRYDLAKQFIDKGITDSNGVASWRDIAVGIYYLEAYHNGYTLPYIGDELWGNSTIQIDSGQTTYNTIKRYEPYTQSIVFKNNSTNEILNSSNPIPSNTTVRVEITVKNEAAVDRSVKVEVLIDRDKIDSYDFNLTIGPQNIAANGGTHTFAATFTPTAEGLYYRGLRTDSYIGTNYKLTDTWAWDSNGGALTVRPNVGDLNVTIRDANSSLISGASIFRYDTTKQFIDKKLTGSNGIAVWTGVQVGTYHLEAYHNENLLPYIGDEFWGNSTKQVVSGQTANVILIRNEPYTQRIVFKNNLTNETLYSSNPIPSNTTIRVEVTVKNDAIVARMVRIEILIDRDKTEFYDFDLIIGPENIAANGGIHTFIKTFIPIAKELYYAGEKTASFIETDYVLTDSWAWGPTEGAFKVNPNSTGNIQDGGIKNPEHFALQQNYPNPFNPSTIIKYSIPSRANVNLQIFDILGRNVATLVNEDKSPGDYEVKFDGSYLSSGIYFCQLHSSNYNEIKKILLIK